MRRSALLATFLFLAACTPQPGSIEMPPPDTTRHSDFDIGPISYQLSDDVLLTIDRSSNTFAFPHALAYIVTDAAGRRVVLQGPIVIQEMKRGEGGW